VTAGADTLLMVIYADPARSGLGTGRRTLQVVLMGPAAKVLTAEVDDLVDGEMIENHLDVFAEWGTPFHVGDGGEAYDLEDAPVKVVPIDAATLARMMAEAHQVMVFP
jgi:hypothetical protein